MSDATSLPNLLIAGVTKAGTTSLFSYLVQHREVCGSTLKETEYFSPLLYPDKTLPPIADYARYFRHCAAARYVMEATPNYWYGGPRLIDATEQQLGEPRYIVSLRDPADRFWSELSYMQSKALLPSDLAAGAYLDQCEAIHAAGTAYSEANRYHRTLSTGFYADHLPELMQRLDGRLRVVFFEDLAEDAARVVGDLFDWLGLDRAELTTLNLDPQNTTHSVRYESLQRVARRVARATDQLTRSRPALKQRLVDGFARLNRGERRIGTLDEPTRTRLHTTYAPANRKLASVLSEAGYTNLPAWLTIDG